MARTPRIRALDVDPTTGEVIAAALRVHRVLGAHFPVSTYRCALACEFQERGLNFAREVRVPVYYRGRKLRVPCVDFVVEGRLVDVHAKRALEPGDAERAAFFLKASKDRLALVLNFGARKLQVKRIETGKSAGKEATP